MFRLTSRLPIIAVGIAAAMLIGACGSGAHSSPHSSRSSRHVSSARMQQDAVDFASCMRSHGVLNFPDPTTSPHEFKQALDPNSTHSPAFTSAVTACLHLLPGGGPPNQSPPHSHAQIVAFLAFARCIRNHGFPTFPDPNSSGDVTHQMVANAGINLHQPAVLQAGDACTSVTHGYITPTDVARFVAGQ